MKSTRFPNESEAYRQARIDLLQAELVLRDQVEKVAHQRRLLPAGGDLKQDYVFDQMVADRKTQVRFSSLFDPSHTSLLVYSFMYAPNMDEACPMCVAFLDALNGQIAHLEQQISIAIVARHGIETIDLLARSRQWRHLRLLSSQGNSYNTDYFGERNGQQMPMANVFQQVGDKITHFWGSEMCFEQAAEGQDSRHLDLMWPLWNVLDLTRAGRGSWYPALSYDHDSQDESINR